MYNAEVHTLLLSVMNSVYEEDVDSKQLTRKLIVDSRDTLSKQSILKNSKY